MVSSSHSFILVDVILFVIPIYPLPRSVFKAISLSDIKSMIAFSTISQISYMFLAIYGGLILVSIFHIIIHALFKSLLFLLSGSLIHVELNFQSIYRLKIYHSFINMIFVLAGSVSILSLSKEGIIHSSHCIISSTFIMWIGILGGIFTMIHTLKIYSFIFYFSSMIYYLKIQLSYVLPWLSISSIFIDQSLEYLLFIDVFLISCVR
jgi:NADH-quinone oxidoreductase subunit L